MKNNNTLRHAIAAVLGGSLLATSPVLLAATDDITTQDPLLVEDGSGISGDSGQVVSKLSAEFSDFLGGEENARGVIEDLRDGSYAESTPEPAPEPTAETGTDSGTTGDAVADAGTAGDTEVTTTSGDTSTDSGTTTAEGGDAGAATVADTGDTGGKMGYGNIRITLKMAQAELGKLGITEAGEGDLAAVLNGGTINGTDLDGILAMRADGMGWGTIAKANGYTVGSLMGNGHAKAPAAPVSTGSDYIPSGSTGSGIATAAGTAAATGKAKGHGKVSSAGDYIPSGKPGKAHGQGMVSGLGGGLAAGGAGKGHGGYKGGGVTVSAAGGAAAVSTAGLSGVGKGGGHGLAKGHNK